MGLHANYAATSGLARNKVRYFNLNDKAMIACNPKRLGGDDKLSAI
jgi:hypothetical protein